MNLILASIKYQLRELKARVSVFILSMSFWRWKTFVFQLKKTKTTKVHYFGRLSELPILKSLLDVLDHENSQVEELISEYTIYVYDFPVPNALRIPSGLSTLVKLDKSIEDILAGYSRSLRRSILKQAPKFRYEEVTEEAVIDNVDKAMLRPYAIARNGVDANQVPIDVVKDLALNHYGHLDLLYEDDKVVGCHLGNSYTRRGKRYWHVNRFGYIEEVFSDYNRLQEVNSANLHLALVSAIENGYDYCDYGYSLARPGSGLIEWKRRRKGFLAKASADCFYIKVPNKNAAQFFWDCPLFSLDGKKINLHLGLPEKKTDEELLARYREMGYDGLTKVYLMCTEQPSEGVIRMFESLYVNLRFKPKIIVSVLN
jgi:hypothetical protein